MILAAAGIAAAVLASSPPAVKHPPAAASGHASSAAPATGFTVCTEPVVSCADAMQAEPASITPSADGGLYQGSEVVKLGQRDSSGLWDP